ncbi:IclR family transcriptional regulator [Isoptericola sp. F-RaC21]|uniref:IclR family transcriptional regulator n=1 Tax=Isoptericola sp. F-RaC21 TaxID=3141452 RepID=UPI00315C0D6C
MGTSGPPQDGTSEGGGRGRRPPHGEPVVDRALSLLDCFSADRPYLSLSELSRASGVPASSALRLATRLAAWGALERLPDGRYSVGVHLYEVGCLAPRGRQLRDIALPYMGDLADATGQHVLLAVRQGEHALLIERLSGEHAVDTLYQVGERLPLHSTGVGRVLLAYADEHFRVEYLARPLVAEPEHVPVDVAALGEELREIVDRRAEVFQRAVPRDVVSVAVPVFGRGEGVIAALSVLVPQTRPGARILLPAIRTAARSISRGAGSQAAALAPPRRRR